MMRSTTNILILNLAISDLLFVIFCKQKLTYFESNFMLIERIIKSKLFLQVFRSQRQITFLIIGHSETKCVVLWVAFASFSSWNIKIE